MLTHGLDLSTTPAKCAFVTVAWDDGDPKVIDVQTPLTAEQIVELLVTHKEEHTAVDVPFGWPDPFVRLLQERREGPLPAERLPDDRSSWRTSHLALRATDRWCLKRTKIRPLPVSFQLLGATAAMWGLIESDLALRGVPIDRAGIEGYVCETYPRAALASWRSVGAGKSDWATLQTLWPTLQCDEKQADQLRNSDDARDALVCAVVARARACNTTFQPEDVELARREGWIHLSETSFSTLADTRWSRGVVSADRCTLAPVAGAAKDLQVLLGVAAAHADRDHMVKLDLRHR